MNNAYADLLWGRWCMSGQSSESWALWSSREGGGNPLRLPDGDYRVGSRPEFEVFLPIRDGTADFFTLRLRRGRAGILPAEGSQVLLDGEPVHLRTEVPGDFSEHTVCLGHLEVRLRKLPAASAEQTLRQVPSARSRRPPAGRASLVGASRFAGACAALALAATTVAGSGLESIGGAGAANSAVSSRTALPPVAKTLGSIPDVQVAADEVPGSPVTATGRLRTQASCDLVAAVRAQYGPSAFLDRTYCLPYLSETLAEALRDTRLAVTITSDSRLAISGVVSTQGAVRIARTVAESYEDGLVDVRVVLDDRANTDLSISRIIAAKVASAQRVGDHGYVVLKNGTWVYPGGAIAPGLELVRITESGLEVSTASGRSIVRF